MNEPPRKEGRWKRIRAYLKARPWFSLNAGASNWLWLTALVIGLDQWTKRLVMDGFEEFGAIDPWPVLRLQRLHNEGAAFSFLADAAGWQRWLFISLGIGVSVAILVWLRRLPARGQHLLAAALCLVMGGALGNVIDRVLWGHVVDFILVFPQWRIPFYGAPFPAFNVADSAITVGACLLILDSLLQARPSRSD